ncbi:splicing factor 3B subunit 3-like [Paramacrobiotus metropolitanus]|uniref:splicing factor 3B subunit 3-like n=1 Tax=Paramacrobiotus metropolitanus TaxID=2943436 RepID=UPI002445E013|nr:splicing factor 3B subunit 3-like [Paramacrobiotus metropolitanus]
MHLYSFTLQRPTGINCAVHGNFTGGKHQEIVLSRGQCLDIIRPDTDSGKMHILHSTDVFGVIRSLASFRLIGGSKDYLILGTDSGKIAILEFNTAKNAFDRIHLETFGKSGCRRIVPGQYLATDPKGRAVMIGAVEKQKLVYIMNRDSQARLTISSPLEAHKANTFLYNVIGVDVGFENPLFACLEMDYEEADNDPTGESAQKAQQSLTYYELDLGLNHVVRKFTETLEERANFLIAVPGGNDGPGGILVCSENYITYKNLGDQPEVRAPVPRRRHDLEDPDRGMMFVTYAAHKTKNLFFFLLQTEQGDVFKVTLTVDDEMVSEIRMKYLDTIPVASALCILRTGFLFVASEFGNHRLCQIAHLGDSQTDDQPEFSSSTPLEEGDTFYFRPREPKNLIMVDELQSLSPILHSRILDLANEDTPQLYTLCGTGARSTLRVLRHGLEITEMAVSELPGNPNAVWTVRKHADDKFDAYIVVSFVNATLVLSIGDTVEEVADSGFLGTTPTIACSLLGDDALIQVYPDGIRHIRADKRVNEWKSPGKRQITKCAVNERQLVISLSGGELVYFEMDASGQLNEYTERKEMQSDVVCMALGDIPPGEQRSRFLAVGLADNTVRLLSLDVQDCLSPLSLQALPAPAESLNIVDLGSRDFRRDTSTPAEARLKRGVLYLNIGLQNGVLLRSVLDPVTGDLSDTRTRYLGSRPVKLFRTSVQGSQAVLALSSRSWLSYHYQNRFLLTPLSYETLEHASAFSSDQCPEGIVAIASNTLRILALDKLGTVFNETVTPLRYTPRKFAIHPSVGIMVTIETDHNAYTLEGKIARKQQMATEILSSAEAHEQEMAKQLVQEILRSDLADADFGAPKAGLGKWASCVRITHPVAGKTIWVEDLPQNEAAFSVAVVKFSGKSGEEEYFVIVGTAVGLQLNPRQLADGGRLRTYRFGADYQRLELLHVTPVDEVPHSIVAFQGRLAVAVGRSLRIYDLGRKKLLRKCESKLIPNMIVDIKTMGPRLYVSDSNDSLFFIKYKAKENVLNIFADDTFPRFITCSVLLDYNTIAVGDKFGNVSVIRLPSSVNEDHEDDPASFWDRGYLNGASQKAETVCMYYVGETLSSLQKVTLIPGGSESLVFTTLSGRIGALVPFTSREDRDFFQHLEMHLRNEKPPLCGRDHLHFRSYYFPVKGVVDGDLCEQYNALDYAKQKEIAEELDRTPNEVAKKLEDIRNRYAF